MLSFAVAQRFAAVALVRCCWQRTDLELLSAAGSGGTSGQGQYCGSYGYAGSDGKIGNLTSKGGVSYGYNDAAHKHAVTHLGGDPKYWYDANPTPLRYGDCAAT